MFDFTVLFYYNSKVFLSQERLAGKLLPFSPDIDIKPFSPEKFMYTMDSAQRYSIVTFFLLTCLLFNSCESSADESKLGPPFEIGGGVAYTWAQQYPEWSTPNYKMGIVNGGIRFFRGLSLQGGLDASLGEEISLKSMNYNTTDIKILEEINESFYETSWIGLRYEVPVPIDKDFYRINSIHATLGISWARYALTSTQWVRNNTRERDQPETKYHIATLSGPYAMVCARWRFDTEASIMTGSWFGSYGVDAGLKYSRYSTCSPRYEPISKAESDFSVLQIFVVGFVKISFFE